MRPLPALIAACLWLGLPAAPGHGAPQAVTPTPLCEAGSSRSPADICGGGQTCELRLAEVCVDIRGAARTGGYSGLASMDEVRGVLPSGGAWSLTVMRPDNFGTVDRGLRKVCGPRSCLLYLRTCAASQCTYQTAGGPTDLNRIGALSQPLFLTGPVLELKADNAGDLAQLERAIFIAPAATASPPLNVQLAAFRSGETVDLPAPRN